MNSVDLVAKLLATENLTVVRNNCVTAFFDVKNRVLSLPYWKDMTPEIEGMLVAHEVGHAIYTTEKYIEETKDDRVFAGYLNVVEDARIEKLMKRKFPGIRKTFNLGYKQLMDRDFFELKDRDFNEMILIDRINLYFKAGYNCGVVFTKTEKEFVDRVDRVESIDDAIRVAKELFDYTKAEREKKKEQLEELLEQAIKEKGEEVDEWDLNDEEVEEEKEMTEGSSERDHSFETIIHDHNMQDGIASETDTKLKQKLEELADETIKHKYYSICADAAVDPIISYKRIITETSIVDTLLQRQENQKYKTEFTKFMKSSDKMVNYLVKEFEMRKSAHAYKRAKIAKSGSLNMSKLYASKLTDDIFKRVTTIPNGKNHGMIFLLDWSGSMHDVIMPTIKQVINLVMFCRRINIPFEVYAFSGCYNNHNMNDGDLQKLQLWQRSMRDNASKNLLYSDGQYALLQLFSNKMSNAEFMTVARRFTTPVVSMASGYSLGDTPLNDALIYMTKYIPQFKKQYNIEKLTFITLTDGQSCGLKTTTPMHNMERNYNEDGTSKVFKIKIFLRDSKTGKDYDISSGAFKQTESLLRLLRDQNDCKIVGFYICKNRIRQLRNVFSDHFGYSDYQDHIKLVDMRSKFKEQGFYSLSNTGRDDLFVIPDTATNIVDSDDLSSIDGDQSAAAIARKFSKMFNTKKHSRVLLDKFIGYVA